MNWLVVVHSVIYHITISHGTLIPSITNFPHCLLLYCYSANSLINSCSNFILARLFKITLWPEEPGTEFLRDA